MLFVESLAPLGVFFEPLYGGFESRSVARHAEARLAHQVNVVRVTAEPPSQFFDGEELGVVVF